MISLRMALYLSLPSFTCIPYCAATAQENPVGQAVTQKAAQPAADASGLHPAFKLSPAQVLAAMQIGREAAKKGHKLDSIMDSFKEMPVWTRGRGGTSHESRVWIWNVYGNNISAMEYDSATKYEDSRVPKKLTTEGYFARDVKFDVLVTSVPKVARNRFQHNKNADDADVHVIKFVLSDDLGNNYAAIEGSAEAKDTSGTMTFTGKRAHTTYGQSQTNSTASGTATGPGGTAYGTAYGSSNSTYTQTEYIPWSVTKPYYQARYIVSFSLFDAGGHARIGPDVKKLTLHIVNGTGELTAVYPLKPPSKARAALEEQP